MGIVIIDGMDNNSLQLYNFHTQQPDNQKYDPAGNTFYMFEEREPFRISHLTYPSLSYSHGQLV
jgi:hypothetical protein